jgi:excisionase family DNA binding protein
VTPLASGRARIPTPGVSPEGPDRRLVSLQEAAVVLGVSVATLRRLVWAGELPVIRLTRRIQLDVRDLDKLIDRRKEGGMR